MLLGRGCAREWESRWSSVDVVSCVVCCLLVEDWGETVWPGRGNGGMGGMGTTGTGTRAKSWPSGGLAHHCQNCQNCLQAQQDVVYTYIPPGQADGGTSQGRLLGRRCFRSGHRDAGLIDDRQQIKWSSCHWRLATQIPGARSRSCLLNSDTPRTRPHGTGVHRVVWQR